MPCESGDSGVLNSENENLKRLFHEHYERDIVPNMPDLLKRETQMGCDREPYPSEETFKTAMGIMLRINNCVWHGGMVVDVREDVEIVKQSLDRMVKQMEEEKR